MNLVAEGDEMDTNPAAYDTSGKLSTDNNKWYIGEDATPVPAGSPDQEPAIVNYFPNAAAEPQSNKPCNKQTGGENLVSANCQTATVQGNANANGKAPHITGRK